MVGAGVAGRAVVEEVVVGPVFRGGVGCSLPGHVWQATGHSRCMKSSYSSDATQYPSEAQMLQKYWRFSHSPGAVVGAGVVGDRVVGEIDVGAGGVGDAGVGAAVVGADATVMVPRMAKCGLQKKGYAPAVVKVTLNSP